MKTAFLFPGQGSQYIGMGNDIFQGCRIAQDIYKTVSDVSGIDIAATSFLGHPDRLKESQNAQLATLTMSLAVFHAMTMRGINPDLIAGHSMGEYSAIIAAKGMEIEEGIVLIRRRGCLMSKKDMKSEGAMAAVSGLPLQEIEATLCEKDAVCIANYNTPSQFVLSGEKSCLYARTALLKEKGAKIIFLPVGGAFHSPLMRDASTAFHEFLKEVQVKDLSYPLIGNVKASLISKSSEVMEEMKSHMLSPVRWYDTVKKMLDMGIMRFVEIGPGHVLKGLMLRIHRKAEVFTTGSLMELENTIEKLS